MAKTARRRRADVIESEFREAGNYWIELKRGWQNGTDPGTHAIVEDTKTAARAKLSSVIPCNCAECAEASAASAPLRVFECPICGGRRNVEIKANGRGTIVMRQWCDDGHQMAAMREAAVVASVDAVIGKAGR